ncbi:MAG TPA: hypothetical protein VHL12_04515 [Gemmatimonadaceae bacterium]|jgi:hypothetical protein|nr:hypothetical protein [Gemmatimonadaceae bacterium]
MNMKTLAAFAAAGLALVACADPTTSPTGAPVQTTPSNAVSTNAANGSQLHGAPEHLFYAKGQNARKQTSVNMLWHNGAILVSNKTQAIFWGPSWTTSTSDIIGGLDTFFAGFGGSNYAAASTEYTGTNGQVTTSSTYLGHVIDASAAPTRALSVTNAVAEACKVTGNNPDPNALYLIYTETGAGHVSYCAWHSYGTCSNGAPVQVAYMPNITGIAGCDPVDTYGTGHSEGLAALANVTAHELSETITDPRNGGWYDSSGAENGDKCAWSFTGPVTLKNGSVWKLQGEWSNNAYSAGTGYPNNSGQKGCLQGA